MGGIGSGTWRRRSKKPTTDELHSVDVGAWKKAGRLEPGRVSHLVDYHGGKMGIAKVTAADDGGSLTVLRRGRAIPLGLTWTACNYGGRRPWFVCPSCSKRAGKLYEIHAGMFYACRTCLGLAYDSQNEAERYRLLRKARKKRDRLGPTREGGRYPRRPKHMRWKTFVRTLHEIQELEHQADVMAHRRFLGGALALLERVDRLSQ